MGAGVLVTQGARVSETMISTMLNWLQSVPAWWGLTDKVFMTELVIGWNSIYFDICTENGSVITKWHYSMKPLEWNSFIQLQRTLGVREMERLITHLGFRCFSNGRQYCSEGSNHGDMVHQREVQSRINKFMHTPSTTIGFGDNADLLWWNNVNNQFCQLTTKVSYQRGIRRPFKCTGNHTYWGLKNNWGMQSKNGLQNLWGNIMFFILC